MKRFAFALILFAGCSQSPPPESQSGLPFPEPNPLITKFWDEQTERIKAHEAFSPTDPSDWMIEYSARINRVLILPQHPERDLVGPIMFETDAAFIAADRPADLAAVDAAEFDAAYRRAKELVSRP